MDWARASTTVAALRDTCSCTAGRRTFEAHAPGRLARARRRSPPNLPPQLEQVFWPALREPTNATPPLRVPRSHARRQPARRQQSPASEPLSKASAAFRRVCSGARGRGAWRCPCTGAEPKPGRRRKRRWSAAWRRVLLPGVRMKLGRRASGQIGSHIGPVRIDQPFRGDPPGGKVHRAAGFWDRW